MKKEENKYLRPEGRSISKNRRSEYKTSALMQRYSAIFDKKNEFCSEEEKYCQKVLERAKASIKAFVMDLDGTIKGGDYKEANPLELLKKIVRAGKFPAVITASGVTALKSFFPLESFYADEDVDNPIFVGIGNGAALYCFSKEGRKEIYYNELTPAEVRAIISVWEQTYESMDIKEPDLQAKGLETFCRFLTADWEGLIPEEYLAVFKPYGGKCFTERVKVTVVLPKWDDDKQRELVKKLQGALDEKLGPNKYAAVRGDNLFLHITRAFDVDSKLFALRRIMAELKLNKDNIAVFGDMPFDNDKGLLIGSNSPYSFTNICLKKEKLEEPPHILPGSSESPVRSVYRAIYYLLGFIEK